MGGLILFIFYGSILFFIIATVFQVRKTISAPLHLSWDLYKGSSIYESLDWWKRTQNPFFKKLGSMILDLLLLREFFYRNRRFWFPLYLFHLGLYSLLLWHGWLFLFALVGNIHGVSNLGWIWGTLSTLVTFIGGGMILYLRVKDEELKIYYPPIHYLKWIFILLTLIGGVYAVDIHFKSNMPDLLKYVRDQVTFVDFEKKLHPSFGPALHILFASGWLLYLPFGHVFQLFFRYYHYLRWDEVPYQRGNQIEEKMKEHLERPAGWSAPHIQSGKQWKEIVSEFPMAK